MFIDPGRQFSTQAAPEGVPSSGWRIREMPDCASSPKTHVELGLFCSKSEGLSRNG
jgi:hypothetical protein